MKAFRSRYARRVFVPVMAVSLLFACVRWEVQHFEPAQLVVEKAPLRLTMLNGDKIRIADPIIFDGKIVGHPLRYVGPSLKPIRSDTLRVPTDSVAYIEIRKANPEGTQAFILGTLGILVTGFLVVELILSNIDPGCCE